MKKISILLALLFATGLYANNGEAIYKAKCASCHLINPPAAMSSPGTPEFKKAINDLKAPPMSKVASMVKMEHESKEAFVNFVSDFITNPDASKAVCMKRAIAGFGLMPPIDKSMSEEDKKAVSAWIYDNVSASKKTKGMKCGEGKCGDGKPKKMKCAAGKCGSK
jgi:uncharacterized low-complexity protein